MSDTNRVGVAIARSGGATFPSALTSLNRMRITGTPNLAFDPLTEVSNEIRDDRQQSDLIPIGAEAGGDVGFEWSYGVADDLIESALLGTWDNTASVTPAAGAQGTGLILAGGDDGFVTGQIVKLIAPSVEPAGESLTSRLYEVGAIIADTSIAVTPLPINALDSLHADASAMSSAFEAGASTVLKVVGFAPASDDIDTTATGLVSPIGIFGDLIRGNGIDGGNVETDFVPGHFIKLLGAPAVTAGINDVYVDVTAVPDANTLTLNVPSSWEVSAATNDVFIFFGDVLINPASPIALASRQFSVERSFNDHTPVDRELFLQMGVNTLMQELSPQSIAVGTVGFFGTTARARPQNLITELYASGDPTRVEAPAFDVYNTSSNVAVLKTGGEPVGAGGANCILNATVEINNNMRRQNAVGVFGACGIGLGELSVTGALETYFDDLSLYNDVLNGTETSLDFILKGNDGRSLLTHVPRIKFTGGAPQVPGKNADVVLPLAYQGLLSSNLGYTLSYQRFTFAT